MAMRNIFIADTAAGRIDAYLPTLLPEYSRSFFKNLLDAGHVLLNGKVARAKDKVNIGDEIAITLPEIEEIEALPEEIPLNIVYEDVDVVVINKARGMVTHPAPGNETGTLVNALLFHIKDLSGINGKLRPGIVHRLDKDTTGLLVVAKNDAAHKSLAEQIAAKEAHRIYTALAIGNIKEEEGMITAPIGRDPKDRKKMAVVHGGRAAASSYRVLERFGAYTLVEVSLQTGRTHQIRVHLKYIGNPVAGDAIYTKAKIPFAKEGQLLHAGKLAFRHPRTDEWMEFEAPLPTDFEKALEKLRNT